MGTKPSEFGFRKIELKAKRGVGSSKILSTFLEAEDEVRNMSS